MKVMTAVVSLAVLLLLGACGYRQDGESCWSDEECISDNCSFGSCSPNLVEWIASWFRDEPEPPPPPPAPPPWHVPQVQIFPPCPWVEEKECRVTPHCTWHPFCTNYGRPQEPDAGVVVCWREYDETGICPSGCTLSGICS